MESLFFVFFFKAENASYLQNDFIEWPTQLNATESVWFKMTIVTWLLNAEGITILKMNELLWSQDLIALSECYLLTSRWNIEMI